MGIEKRILHLLYFKDCVIIPGFGGFVTKYVSAKMKEESQSFMPPSKEIVFNRDLTKDDGVLTEYIAQFENLTKSDAGRRVEKFVNYIYRELAEKGSVKLEHLGFFRYEKTGELVFKLDSETNFLPSSFGLSSFYFSKYEKESVSPLVRTAIFRNRDKGHTVALPGTLERVQRQRSIRRVAVALPLLITLSLIPLNNRDGQRSQQNNAGFFPLPSLSVVEIQDSENSTKDVSSTFDYTDPGVENNGDVIILPPIDRNSFVIVAGSFSAEKNARILAQDLNEKGYGSEIWEATNGFFRVVMQGHNTMAEAQQSISELKKDLSDIEFWVLQ